MSDPIELAAIERGAGSPVALVHGGVIHSGPSWAKSIGPLAQAGFRVIAVDRRGHGRSEPGDSPKASLHLQADDLRLTLELRDAKQVHLVGVSYGALVCLEFALSWPDRVKSATFIEPPLIGWVADDPDFGSWYQRFVQVSEYAKTAPLEEWFPQWLSLIDGRMAAATSPGTPLWEVVERQGPLIFKEETGWEYAPDEDAIAALDVPAVVMSGDQSEPPMQEIAMLLAKRLPNAVLQRSPSGGHDFHARRAEYFNETLIGFLNSVEGQQA